MNAMRSAHSAFTHFPVVDGCLQIGGMPLTRLAQRVGKTPFYAYSRSAVAERIQHLRNHLPAEILLHYSVKANPMPALVQQLAGLVDGFDVASAGELKVALDTPVEPKHVGFAGPGKSQAELEQAVAAGVVIHLESESEVERVARIGDLLGITPRVTVRVNPDFEMKSSGMKMGGGPKQFGIDTEQVPLVLRKIGALGLDFQGFHIYSGSQNLRPEAIMEAQSNTLDLAIRLAQDALAPVRLLNIGGGFGVPYFPGEAPLDLRPIGDNLDRLLPQVRTKLPEAEVVLEMGRYLVCEAGIYVCRVIDRKISRGQVFLVTDGGMHHNLAASGNLGQVIRKNYPVAVGNKMTGTKREIASVVGPLCTPLDLLADKVEMAYAEAGDLIVVFQSGAYGLTASPTGFLSHLAPAEVLV